MSPLTLRPYLLDSRPVTWWDLASVNDPWTMEQIGALEPGQAVTLGMCSEVERLPDAPFGYTLAQHPATWNQRFRVVCVGPDDVAAATGLEVPGGIDLDQRAQVWAARPGEERRALPSVLG